MDWSGIRAWNEGKAANAVNSLALDIPNDQSWKIKYNVGRGQATKHSKVGSLGHPSKDEALHL